MPLQIGALKDYYHFYHSRTIKRSVLSSRGTHSFISMEPKVRRTSGWGPRSKVYAFFIGDNILVADDQYEAQISRTVILSFGTVFLLPLLMKIGNGFIFD